jgi:Glycosyl-hydrolase family 116, catalytic region
MRDRWLRRYMAVMAPLIVFLALTGVLSARGQIMGGMHNPSIDPPGEPFSYFWHPTDVLGTLFAPVASEVTSEGYVYTGFGELMFFTGNPPQPGDQRIKTLENGYLPVVEYQVKRDNLTYRFTLMATDLGGPLAGVPVNLIRVEVKNETGNPRVGFFASAFRVQPPQTRLEMPDDFRFQQNFGLIPDRLTGGQVKFSPAWRYSFTDTSLVRDGSILYSFPQDVSLFQTSMAERDSGIRVQRFLSGQIEGQSFLTGQIEQWKVQLTPSTPMGFVQYRFSLKPGERKELVFKLPLAPLPQSSPEAQLLAAADYGHEHERQAALWTDMVEKKTPITIPEEKVQQSLLANTIYSLLAVDKVGDDYVPNVNKFQYHTYFPTDTSLMAVSLDDMGQTSVARDILLYGIKSQHPDGSVVLEHDLWESFGHILWAWNRHYTLTKDDAFLGRVYPAVVKSMSWEMKITAKDNLGLIPAASIFDDAQLADCHQTGQDIWTLVGIEAAVQMAHNLGKTEDATRFQAEYDRFRAAFDKALALQTAKTGGYVPPSLDHTLAGNDWDNLHLLYPAPLFDPSDPRVAATDKKVRASFKEGILPYILPNALSEHDGKYTFDEAPRLHYWHTPDIAENELVRGRPEAQKEIVEDLYALLVHTTSTHAAQEFGAYPWSTRDYMPQNILPDGSTSAVLVELIRNMLVREYKNELHFFSAVSPDWLGAGKSIDVTEEPTNFGPVSASMRLASNVLTVNLANHFRSAPAKIIIHIPWFYEATSVEVDGRSVAVHDAGIEVSADAKTIQLRGGMRSNEQALSYSNAVKEYKAEYASRYSKFLQTGEIAP